MKTKRFLLVWLFIIMFISGCTNTKFVGSKETNSFEPDMTIYQQVDDVLKGDLKDNDEVYVMQLGDPESDLYETKLKQNHQYILYLTKKPTLTENEEPVYDLVSAEQGIFEIKSDGTLFSYYDEGVVAEYDNQSKNSLIAKTKEIVGK